MSDGQNMYYHTSKKFISDLETVPLESRFEQLCATSQMYLILSTYIRLPLRLLQLLF